MTSESEEPSSARSEAESSDDEEEETTSVDARERKTVQVAEERNRTRAFDGAAPPARVGAAQSASSLGAPTTPLTARSAPSGILRRPLTQAELDAAAAAARPPPPLPTVGPPPHPHSAPGARAPGPPTAATPLTPRGAARASPFAQLAAAPPRRPSLSQSAAPQVSAARAATVVVDRNLRDLTRLRRAYFVFYASMLANVIWSFWALRGADVSGDDALEILVSINVAAVMTLSTFFCFRHEVFYKLVRTRDAEDRLGRVFQQFAERYVGLAIVLLLLLWVQTGAMGVAILEIDLVMRRDSSATITGFFQAWTLLTPSGQAIFILYFLTYAVCAASNVAVAYYCYRMNSYYVARLFRFRADPSPLNAEADAANAVDGDQPSHVIHVGGFDDARI